MVEGLSTVYNHQYYSALLGPEPMAATLFLHSPPLIPVINLKIRINNLNIGKISVDPASLKLVHNS